MKYVYAKDNINYCIPNNVPVRMLVGGILGLASIIPFFWIFASKSLGDIVLPLVFFVVLTGSSFLFFYFAIRTGRAISRTKPRTPEDAPATDEKHPFYSSQCANCGVLIDYQQEDLAYRLWFIKGYVECPCCCKPIRHDKSKNFFVPHRYPEQHPQP